MNRLRIVLLICLMIPLRLFSLEFTCPYGICTNPDENSDYSLINKKVRALFRKIEFAPYETMVIGGYGYAEWETSFFPKHCEPRYEQRSILGERSYVPKYELTWGDIERGDTCVERIIENISPEGPMLEQSRFFSWRSFHESAELFSQLHQDIDLYFNEETAYLDLKINDLKRDLKIIMKKSTHFDADGDYVRSSDIQKDFEKKTLSHNRKKDELNASHAESIKSLYNTESEINAVFRRIYAFCLDNHNNNNARYELGMIDFYEGNTLDALVHIKKLISQAELENNLQGLSSNVQLLNGKLCNELCLYQDAITALCQSIHINPENKESYFERAIAYFETGKLDLSISDYLTSQMKPQPLDLSFKDKVDFSLGLSLGIVKGGADGLIDFVPSMLSSLEGLSHGLWAFAKDPVQVSNDFLDATCNCINFIRENTPTETILTLVPELQNLVRNWDTLPQMERGEIAGQIIGKYGVDIFAGAGVTKCMSAYRNLKKANNLLTFEAAAISQRNKAQIALQAQKRAAARKEILQSANLKIQWDKQGKHIEGHVHFNPQNLKSVLTHPNPQKLIDNFAGKGMPIRGKSGTPGYQEIVDFGEIIGYSVNRDTGEKIATSWGKIHYAKDGVHIVPAKPW